MDRFNGIVTTQKGRSRRDFVLGTSKFCLGALLLPLESLAQLQSLVVVVGIDLGKKLYDKILNLVSATIYDKTRNFVNADMFGNTLHSEFPEPTIGDVKGWINGAVIDLESRIDKVSEKIDQVNLEQMQNKLEAIKSGVWHYLSLPPQLRSANRGLLEFCDDRLNELLPLSQNYYQALFFSSVTLAHKLLVRFLLFALDSETGQDASGHVTSLVDSNEMNRYFNWATKSSRRPSKGDRISYSINGPGTPMFEHGEGLIEAHATISSKVRNA